MSNPCVQVLLEFKEWHGVCRAWQAPLLLWEVNYSEVFRASSLEQIFCILSGSRTTPHIRLATNAASLKTSKVTRYFLYWTAWIMKESDIAICIFPGLRTGATADNVAGPITGLQRGRYQPGISAGMYITIIPWCFLVQSLEIMLEQLFIPLCEALTAHDECRLIYNVQKPIVNSNQHIPRRCRTLYVYLLKCRNFHACFKRWLLHFCPPILSYCPAQHFANMVYTRYLFSSPKT